MRLAAAALLIPAFWVAGCSHAAKTVKAEAPPPAGPAAVEPEPAVAPSARPCSADDQCGASELCVAARCVAIAPGLAECRASAHFDFDRADIRAEDRPKLQRVARCLAALPDALARAEGDCDERGTEQYNIALGFRRAHAAASYVEALGVGAGRLSEVSYGKERPLCTDSTESCWAENRRADVAPAPRAKDATARGSAPTP